MNDPRLPDPDEVLRTVKGNQKSLLLILVVIAAMFAGSSSLYTVGPDEEGVVLRFGRFSQTTGPGLKFKLPFGIDEVYKVRTKRIHKAEFGFRTESAGVQTRYSSRDFSSESLMLTGDLNVADVQWIVQYRISDPKAFLFNVRNVSKNIRDIAEASMRVVVGDRTVTDVLTVGRTEIGARVETKMQESIDRYDMGISIVTVKLQDVNPPKPVQPSFNEVNAAKQEQERLINEARRAYNKAIPSARGEAQKMIAEARGYATERINRARGDAERFAAVYTEYRRAPDVTRDRLYLEAMQAVLPKIERIVVADPKVRSLVPLLNLAESKGAAK